jgi:putative flippase GtrA
MRWLAFNAVGATGFAVQLGSLYALREGLGLPYAVAAALAVELAILHNFAWHVAWTWGDRPAPHTETVRRLGRFHAANGAISLAGNVALIVVLVEAAGLHYLVASVVSVALCSLANFLAGDRLVFKSYERARVPD